MHFKSSTLILGFISSLTLFFSDFSFAEEENPDEKVVECVPRNSKVASASSAEVKAKRVSDTISDPPAEAGAAPATKLDKKSEKISDNKSADKLSSDPPAKAEKKSNEKGADFSAGTATKPADELLGEPPADPAKKSEDKDKKSSDSSGSGASDSGDISGPPDDPGSSSEGSKSDLDESADNPTGDTLTEAPAEPGIAPLTPASIVWDRFFSPYVGASFNMTLLRAYQALDDRYLKSTENETGFFTFIGRLLKTGVVETTLFSTMTVAQHEVFGHGFRGREFDVGGLSYLIRPFTGATYFNPLDAQKLSLSQQIAAVAGGIEADSILAHQLRVSWLNPKTLDYRAGLLYLLASYDQTGYVLFTTRNRDFTLATAPSNDILNYINSVNQWYGRNVLNRSKLRGQIWLDFIDPFFFFSLYAVGRHIYDGMQFFEFPMIPIGKYRYLPALRLALAPYGTEYQFFNFIRANSGPECSFIAMLRWGNTGNKTYFGVTLDRWRLYTTDLFVVDARADVWSQPKLFTVSAAYAPLRFGGALSLTGRYQISNCFQGLIQVGYKSDGFMQGETLRHGPILRLGINIQL